MRVKFYTFTKLELDELEEQLNLSDSEEIVFNGMAKHKSIIEIADDCGVSPATVSRLKTNITNKYMKLV